MKAVFAVAAVGASILVSFIAGSRIGTTQHYLADAQYRASFAAARLKMIELGRMDDLKASLELEVDSGIARHADYLDSNLKFLWPELGRDDRAVASAVRYRLTHPYTPPDLSKIENPDAMTAEQLSFAKAVAADQKRDEQLLQQMIEKYRPE